MRKLIWVSMLFLLVSCDNSGDIWVHSGDSVTINETTISLTSHWYTMRDNDDICAIYSDFFGGNLLLAKMYKGKVVDEKAEVYLVKKLYGTAMTAYEHVDPTVITFRGNEISVKIEIPDHELDLGKIIGDDAASSTVHHFEGEIRTNNYAKVQHIGDMKNTPVNEERECRNNL